MRTLNEHQVNPANDKLVVTVTDDVGAGGANHLYKISGYNDYTNPSAVYDREQDTSLTGVDILFQNGPISEDGNGVNGVTHEVLLAIVADRLRSFQAGAYACKANACALTHIEEALHWLQQRTLSRMRRGVEGTHVV